MSKRKTRSGIGPGRVTSRSKTDTLRRTQQLHGSPAAESKGSGAGKQTRAGSPAEQCAHGANPSLDNVLESVRREMPPPLGDPSGYAEVFGPGYAQPHPWLAGVDADKAIPVMRVRIRELLEILWADLEFWSLLVYGPASFTVGEIIDLPSLSGHLSRPSARDKVSEYLRSHLSTRTLEFLSQYSGGPRVDLEISLVEDLNGIVTTESVFDAERFVGVNLSAPTQDLLQENQRGDLLARLNYRLIADAYPSSIRPCTEPRHITWVVCSWYGLWLPELSVEVWRAFGCDSGARERLFSILCEQAWRLNPPSCTTPVEKALRSVLRPYLRYCALDLKSLLSSRVLTKEVFRLIHEFASRLKSDSQWCLANPGKIAPMAMRKHVGHPEDVHVARRRERMLQLFKENPDATQWQIAQSCADKTVNLRALRRDARRAALLLKLREGVSVKRYVDAQGYGRRPKRRSERGK